MLIAVGGKRLTDGKNIYQFSGSGLRLAGVNYANNTGDEIIIIIMILKIGAGSGGGDLYVGPVSPATIQVGSVLFNTGTNINSIYYVIPKDWFYRVTFNGGAIETGWQEQSRIQNIP